MKPPYEIEKRASTGIFAVFLCATAVVIFIAYNNYQDYKRQRQTYTADQLANISLLKVDELVHWRKTHLINGEVFRLNQDFVRNVQNWFANPQDAESLSYILAWLESCQVHKEYEQIQLLDLTGTPLLSNADTLYPIPAVVLAQIPEITRTKAVSLVSFYQDPANQKPYMGLLIPILNHETQNVMSFVSIRINPTVYLYPYLQTWPLTNTTGETMLIGREGETVVLLNPSRSNPQAALNIQYPLTKTEIPAVQAALGKTGFVEGTNHLGEPILADIRPVPDSPWLLITKINRAEAYATLPTRLRETVLFSLAIISINGLVLLAVWRQARLRYYRERLKITEALSQSEERYQNFIAHSFEAISRTEFDKPIDTTLPIETQIDLIYENAYMAECNQAMADMYHLPSPKAFVGLRLIEAHRGKDNPVNRATFRKFIENGYKSINDETVEFTNDGVQVWFLSNTIGIIKNKQLIRLWGTAINITERKQMEETQRIAEIRYRALFEQSHDAIFLLDPQGQHLAVNQRAANMLGYTPSEMIGLSVCEISAEIPESLKIIEKILNGEHIPLYERRFRKKNGEILSVEINLELVRETSGTPLYIQSVVRDISKRKQAEAALRESEARAQALLKAIPDLMFRLNREGVFLDYKADIHELYTSPENFIGKRHTDVLPTAFADQLDQQIQNALQTGTLQTFVYTLEMPALGQQAYEARLIPSGPDEVLAIVRNITERKHAEEVSHAREELYQLISTINADYIFSVEVTADKQMALKWVGGGFEAITGYTFDEYIALGGWWKTLHPDDVTTDAHNTARLHNNQKVSSELRTFDKNGNLHWVEVHANPLWDEARQRLKGIYGTVQDITARKQAEQQLQETQDRFHSLYETMLDGVIYQDREGKILSANPSAEQILGLSLDEIRGLSTADMRWQAIREDGTPFSIETLPGTIALQTGQPIHDVVMGIYIPEKNVTTWLNVNTVPQFIPGDPRPVQVYTTFRDISRKKQDELITEKRLTLLEYVSGHTFQELMQKAIDLMCELCTSPVGFFHEVINAGTQIRLLAWSTQTLEKFCELKDKSGMDYSLEQAGIWADAARKGHSVIHNDYFLTPNRKGLPEGHTTLTREMVTPIIRNGQVVAMVGVGNKANAYTQTDSEIASRFADYLWDIMERKQAEQALRTSEERYRSLALNLEARVRERTAEVQDLYNHAPNGYHALDEKGAFTMINQTELNWLGYTREEVLGHLTFFDWLTPESTPVFEESLAQLHEKGTVNGVELELRRKDGSRLPVLYNATAIYDVEGNLLNSRATIFDITDRKISEEALRESEERLHFLLANTPAVIFTAAITEHVPITFISQSVRNLLGREVHEYLHKPSLWLTLIHTEEANQLHEIYASLRQRGYINWEVRAKHIDGTYRWLAIGLSLMHDAQGQPTEIIGYAIDIDDQKKAQEALQISEARLRQSRDDLSLANAALAQAARLKDEFLANMSHELRTPLNAILAFSEGLLEQYRGPLNERQLASVRNIETSGRHLLTLINDILDLSKVEAGRLDLQMQPVSLADVCEASLLFVNETAAKKTLKLAYHLDDHLAVMQADPKRLKQMLVNLLSNAVKFTPNGGQIRLEVITDAQVGMVSFTIADTGIGISPEDLTRLFRPFSQLDSSLNRQHEGTGLGLALVRRLAEVHGGSVSVHSVIGEGSRFTIALPYTSPIPSVPKPALSPPLPKKETGPLHTVLIIDDSESTAEQLTRYVQELGILTFVHALGKGALEQAIELHPTVILLDLLMPDASGWDVLHQLKTNPQTLDIPVIIISVVDERSKGLSAGAAEYLVKPVTREVVQEALHTVAGFSRNIRHGASLPSRKTLTHILLAEDNEFNIQAISDYLEAKGYLLSIARNGREALEIARESPPDLILMDIQMPEMDGLEAIRRLRAMPTFTRTPIIALTALAMPGDQERCLDAGANEYLKKPVSLRDLAENIQILIAQ